jgi:disulfide bond formation protein DsbB
MAVSARALALVVPAMLLGGAYIAQYYFGLPPCEMCWWQRYPLFAALALALAAWVRPPASMLVALAGLAILTSGAIGGYHAGVEYGWWEGLTSCSSNVLAGAADPLQAILDAPIVRCDVAPWSLLGISLAGFNFLISGAAGLAILRLVAQGGARPA